MGHTLDGCEVHPSVMETLSLAAGNIYSFHQSSKNMPKHGSPQSNLENQGVGRTLSSGQKLLTGGQLTPMHLDHQNVLPQHR